MFSLKLSKSFYLLFSLTRQCKTLKIIGACTYRKRLKKYSFCIHSLRNKEKKAKQNILMSLRVWCEDILLESIKAEFKLKKTHFLRAAKSGLYFPSARSFLTKTSSMAEIIKHKLEREEAILSVNSYKRNTCCKFLLKSCCSVQN
jgi:hypothetical protein